MAVGIALAIVGIAIIAAARERYTVRLHGADGAVAAIQVPDDAQAEHVVSAISDAIDEAS